MTDPSDFDQREAVLPGLEPARPHSPAIVLATRRTIAQLVDDGLADESHAMLLQLLLDLADVVDTGRRQGKASAVAMAAAQMLAAYAVLVPPTDDPGGGDTGDAFDELAGDLRCGAGLCDHEEHRASV